MYHFLARLCDSDVNDHSFFIEIETKDPLVLRACQLRQEFFTPETLTEICSRLVTHYFLLTPADLEMWDTHPENFGKHGINNVFKNSK